MDNCITRSKTPDIIWNITIRETVLTWEWNCILNEKTLSLGSTRGTFINSRKNCHKLHKAINGSIMRWEVNRENYNPHSPVHIFPSFPYLHYNPEHQSMMYYSRKQKVCILLVCNSNIKIISSNFLNPLKVEWKIINRNLPWVSPFLLLLDKTLWGSQPDQHLMLTHPRQGLNSEKR